MPEEPPDRTQTYNFLSRQQLQEAAKLTTYALQKRANGNQLNGEVEGVRTFCRDLRNKFETTPAGEKLRDTRSIDHIHTVTNEYYERIVSGDEFPQRVREFITGLEKIETMTPDEARKYKQALSKFDQPSSKKFKL